MRTKSSNRAVDRARGRSSRRAGRRGDACVREAGAFTKLIEIPLARGVARAAVAPAKKFFLDGERRGEREFANVTVRAPDADVEAYERAPMQALSGYDVGEVPFVMQAVCYYEETLDVGVLERGLSATLAKYPMLAGRLDLRTPGWEHKGAKLTNDGVPLRVVCDDDLRFENLPQDYAGETRRFLDFSPWIDVMLGDAPLFTAKVICMLKLEAPPVGGISRNSTSHVPTIAL